MVTATSHGPSLDPLLGLRPEALCSHSLGPAQPPVPYRPPSPQPHPLSTQSMSVFLCAQRPETLGTAAITGVVDQVVTNRTCF